MKQFLKIWFKTFGIFVAGLFLLWLIFGVPVLGVPVFLLGLITLYSYMFYRGC